eukprot:TRINITY_DN12842_c0_g1_i1.p1 TRINITY_DN12842_c0_g1~~TRINITY_DN12842_c0_g1_i1.p1  ORF type:complete len:105 (-),score=5.92 TRINITY_DN12842_c0_g1_i1:53-367(-)
MGSTAEMILCGNSGLMPVALACWSLTVTAASLAEVPTAAVLVAVTGLLRSAAEGVCTLPTLDALVVFPIAPRAGYASRRPARGGGRSREGGAAAAGLGLLRRKV